MPRKPKAEFEITATDKAQAVLKKVDGSLQGLSRTAALGSRALGGLLGAAGVAEIAKIADEYNQYSARIRTATKDTGDFERVQRELAGITASVGSEFESTIDIFQRLSQVRGDIGATNDQMLTLTRTVQELGAIGGTSQDALNRGLLQFGQALSEGVFRAQEFNSLVESMPELVKRLADGLGKSQGELRQMVLDGQLLATDVINTLLAQAPEISKDFQAIPTNLDRAFAALKTSVGFAASSIDESVGITRTLAEIVQTIAREIAVASNNASDIQILEDQGADIDAQIASVGRQLETLRQMTTDPEKAPSVLELKAQLELLKVQKETNDKALEIFRNIGGGQVTGSTKESGSLAGEGLQESIKAAESHFAAMLGEEQKYLDTQRELRLRGTQELWEAIAAEEDTLFADALARALGFEDARAQALYEKEELFHQATLEANIRRAEELLAQELGFEDVRTQALAEQEQEFQDQLWAIRTKGNSQAQKQIAFMRKYEEAQGAQKINVLLGQAQSLTAGMAQSSRAMFNINKGLAIASAILNAQGAAVAAWEKGMQMGGPYVAAAFTAASLAQTGAMIAQISSTQFGGASSGLTSTGPGTGVPSLASEPLVNDIPSISIEERNQSTTVLRIEVDDPVLQTIFREARVMTDEGDEVFIGERSRQAIEIGG